MARRVDAESGATKRHGITLVFSLLLSLGPLIGAIWSAVGFLLQRHEIRALHRAGEPILEAPRIEPLPIIIGFALFPIGLFLLSRTTMWFSHHVRKGRSKHVS